MCACEYGLEDFFWINLLIMYYKCAVIYMINIRIYAQSFIFGIWKLLKTIGILLETFYR
jgi:hypothetical protein